MARSRWSNPLFLAAVGLALMVGGWKASTDVPRTPRDREQSRRLDELRAAAREDPELAGRLDDIAAGRRGETPYRLAGRVALLMGLMLFVAAGVLMYRRPPAEEDVEQEGVEREGSSTDGLFLERLGWARRGRGQVELTLSAHVVGQVTRLLRARLLHRRVFRLWCADGGVRFERAGEPAWREEEGWLVVGLPAGVVRQISERLQPRRGVYSWPEFKAFSLRVVPGKIKDARGKVIEVVG